MPKWQHKRFPVPRTPNWDHDGALARFSEEGWELVAVAPASGVTVEVWYFKMAELNADEIVEQAVNGDVDAAETCVKVMEGTLGK